VQLEPNRERLTLHCLSAVNGFEIYSPRILIKAPRSRRDDVTQPLFPNYAFVLIVLQMARCPLVARRGSHCA
jgi:hypothetical protein